MLALLIALTLIPTFFYWSARRREPAAKQQHRMYRFYDRALGFCARRRVWVLGIVAWLVGVPVWLLPDRVGQRQTPWANKSPTAGKVETRQAYRDWLATRDTMAASGSLDRAVYEQEEERRSAWGWLSDEGTRLYNNAWGNPVVAFVKPALNRIFGGATYYLFRDVAHRVEEAPYRHIMKDITEGFSLIVYLEMPYNAHVSRLDGLLKGIEKQLLSFAPYIEGVITRSSGRYGLIQILLKDEYRNSTIPYSLYEHLVAYGDNIGGVGFGVRGQDMDPAGKPLGGGVAVTRRLEIQGYNLRQVGEIAEGIARRLKERRSRRIRDVQVDRTYGPPRYEMLARIDHTTTSRLGVDHTDVVDEIQTRLDGGSLIPRLSVDGREVPAAIADTAAGRTDLRRLSQVRLEGRAARIGHVSRLEKQFARPVIKRENQRYLKEVGFTILGDFTYSEHVVEDVMAQTPLPYGYSLTRGYIWKDLNEEEERELAFIVLLSVMLVWMITSALFESWTRPILVLIALPLALIGVGAGFFLSGAPFNQGGYASLLLLMGISVNNAILLVHHISRMLRARQSSPMEAIVKAAFQRLRPIFITTLTTVAGFLPLMLHGDRSDIWYTLAIGTSGGLVVSSALLVIVVPICMIPCASLRRPAASGTGA